jgi:prephenate dehydrogenase
MSNSLRLAPRRGASTTWKFVARSFAENLQGMRQIEEGANSSARVDPVHGNFITVRVGKANEMFRRLLKRGVIVRPVAAPTSCPSTCASPSARPRRTRGSCPRSRPASRTEGRMFFERVAIVGVGLIGGLFLGIEGKEALRHVVGAGRSAANLSARSERGVIDSSAADAARPRRQRIWCWSRAGRAIRENFPRHRTESEARVPRHGRRQHQARRGRRGAQALGGRIAQFVPAHPIAGAEKSGAAAASAGCFEAAAGLTPLIEKKRKIVESIPGCGRSRRARLAHDARRSTTRVRRGQPPAAPARLRAGERHRARADAAQLFGYAAAASATFTRIASSHPEMWRDICVANATSCCEELIRYRSELGNQETLETEDANALEKLFADARAARERWLNGEYE